jgi:TolA-binding protein
MTEAVITALATLAVCLVNNHYQQKAIMNKHNAMLVEADRKHDETINMIDYKLEQLTKRVDKHNNLVERLYIAEKQIEINEEKIRVANHRIKDLEEGKG